MLAGFFSGGNKLTLIGSFRLISQKIAFNISVSLNLLTIALLAGSFNLHEIIFIQINTN
jgi:NADH:ubiquinone oxidoreductase subunit H